MQPIARPSPVRPGALAVLLACGVWSLAATAASIDISNEPLINKAAIEPKPNILFILDNSGSMGRAYMPDEMYNSGTYGYWSAHCNGVAYDKDQTYKPPLNADGSSFPNASFTAAWADGYRQVGSVTYSSSTSLSAGTGSKTLYVTNGSPSFTTGAPVALKSGGILMQGTVSSWSSSNGRLVLNITSSTGSGSSTSWEVHKLADLTDSAYYVYTGTQPRLGWEYTDTSVVQNTFYNECMTSTGTSSSVFTRVTVGSSSDAAVKQNYANWYSYYRTRRLTMRWAVGKAFSDLDNGYRVGFSTITERTADDGDEFLNIRDFDSTQKSSFFTKLYAAEGSYTTPLRGALSKAGRYYANKVDGQDVDPVQYACQRNFAILSTDGYWNTGAEKYDGTASTNFGAFQLDNVTLVGQQDAIEDRPKRDSLASVTERTVTPYTVSQDQTSAYSSQQVMTWQRTRYYATGSAMMGRSSCSGSRKRVVAVIQTATQILSSSNISEQQSVTGTYTVTETTIDGDPQDPVTSSTTWDAPNVTATVTTPVITTPTPPTASLVFTDTSAYWYNTSCSNSPSVPATTAATSSGPVTQTTTPTVTVTSSTSPVAGAPTTTTEVSGGSSNSLADVAQYYWKTDLRDTSLGNCISGTSGEDVCSNTSLDATPDDPNQMQHMNTFTIGMGVSGTLKYADGYLSHTADTPNSDFARLISGDADWPVPYVSSNGGRPTNIDDLWHAAVNGRGRYFSALNAAQLGSAISGVLSDVQSRRASGSAVASSSLQLLKNSENYIFEVLYTTIEWTGDLRAYDLDSETGEVGQTPIWSAKSLLNARAYTDRSIYFLDASDSADKLSPFNYEKLEAAGLSDHFEGFCNSSRTPVPAQCTGMATDKQALADDASNLINWVRGATTYEDDIVYRDRDAVLGDIINGAPVYVGKPPFAYADTGYSTFVSEKATRTPVVYTAANDGMLHAFSAATNGGGSELWAYVPSQVMPHLYKLADTDYGDNHIYTADGAPVMGDIQAGGAWRTIVVAGLNAGGKGYYALDITDPTAPKGLWEISSSTTGFANLGLSYGNPVITKLSNGKWVVVFASGYNNADGEGYLYVVDAYTGSLLTTIETGEGSTSTPAGLAKINAWVDSTSDNTAARFYGGDMLGNLWRFAVTVSGTGSYSGTATKLASLTMDGGTTGADKPQPITTRPELVQVSYSGSSYPVVLVGTGRYLGVSDLDDTTVQSVYAIKDPLTSEGWGDVRSRDDMVVQELSAGSQGSGGSGSTGDSSLVFRSITDKAVNWSKHIGWRVDFDLAPSGERIVTNMGVQYNTLAFATAVPVGDVCASSGSSWFYFLNVADGTAQKTVNDVPMAGYQFSDSSIVVGFNWVQLSTGETVIYAQDNKGDRKKIEPPNTGGSGTGGVRRSSWRELVD